MHGGRADASTSTDDDIKGRPLCLFYFTHPFGVLSPDPPTITTAPEHISRTFVNMEPISPYNFWSSTTQDSYNTASSSTSKVSYNVGNVTIPRKPINLISVPKYTVDFDIRKDSSSSFSNDLWLSTSSGSKEFPRRMLPYNRILPPLQLPTPILTESSDDFWTGKSVCPAKFSLPPIDIPTRCEKKRQVINEVTSDDGVKVKEVGRERAHVRVCGVKKASKRVKLSGIRRMVTCLMQRSLRGRKEQSSSPAIQEALNTIREAWAEPKSLFERCRALTRVENTREGARERDSTRERDSSSETTVSAMLKRAQLAELSPRPDASPGMLRRRYSMPETIMRKYKLAQLKSDSEDSSATTAPSRAASPASPPRGSCASLCEPPHRFLRRDRELMRKSALLRRLWARPNCNQPCPACCYCSGDLYDSQADCGRETRSLDGSRSELRHLSSSFTSSRYSRESHMLAGWSTPKRQKLESPNNAHSSDEMLRTAMRNSYDRAEELRAERETHEELSDSTYQSHNHGAFSDVATSSDTPFTDSTKSETNSRNIEDSSDGPCTESLTALINSDYLTSQETQAVSMAHVQTDEQPLTDTDSTFSASMSTAKETNGSSILNHDETTKHAYIDVCINEKPNCIDNDDKNIELYNRSPKSEAPYEILEIVISETLNSSAFDNNAVPAIRNVATGKGSTQNIKLSTTSKKMQNIDIDEYVSNILVESLNSLTDQLESMNASIGSERKISIVEKEIKVKLQNTGVNTIVHLSPTSNNQIIFGNEELCNKDHEENKDHTRDIVTIRDEVHTPESNNNYTMSPEICREIGEYTNEKKYSNDNYESIPHDNVNKAVLQQIQKLFEDELQNVDANVNYPQSMLPGISHIEISNVDVFIDENTESNYETNEITLETDKNINSLSCNDQYQDMLSGVGAGNYYKNMDDPVLVPRFSAFPNTESMEVNTSSSDDAEIIGSECTSLVDSLDDPNSPRSMFLKRSFNNKRSELVRSAIDVLDLLPEGTYINETYPKEKNEAFFVRIKDNDCDCEKENIVVADHMPEKIKQRLYRRHRKRELRMECAKRKKVKQFKREIQKQRYSEMNKSKKEIEKDCMSIINSLIEEVIVKITQEEYKYMRIKQKSNNQINKKTDDCHSLNNSKRSTWKKDNELLNNLDSFKISKNGTVHFCEEDIETNHNHGKSHRSIDNRHQVRGKLSLQTHPLMTPGECGPKRIYQKSEIHDGNKCIEILEILEYADSSQSSETINSDENQNNNHNKMKKSRIPIPIYERMPNLPMSKSQKPYKSSPILNCENNDKSRRLIASMLFDALSDDSNGSDINIKGKNRYVPTPEAPMRRASVPHETRSRSNSLRFKQVFDIIPEEKSSLSIESPTEDMNYNRRVSAPNLSHNLIENNNNNIIKRDNSNQANRGNESQFKDRKESVQTKSVAVSPLSESSSDNIKSPQRLRNKIIMTSPIRKSAVTSPILTTKTDNKSDKACGTVSSAKKSSLSHGTRAGWLGFYKPNKQILDEEGLKENKSCDTDQNDRDKKSVHTQYDMSTQSTVRTIELEKTEPIIIGKDKPRVKSEKSRESKSRGDKQKDVKRKKVEKLKQEIRDKQKINRDGSLVRSLSDPQSNDVVIRKTDTKKIQVISFEKSEEETIHPKAVKLSNSFKDKNPDLSTSESDSDSGKSLLCSLAPKWLSVGNMRQKRQVKKKPSQEQQSQQSSAALPADVEMRLSFPKTTTQHVTSQSDSGFGDECRTRRPIAAAVKHECQCRHCDDCTCSNRLREEQDDSYPPILPPASRKMTFTMKKQSSGSSILASKSTKKSLDALPDVDNYKSSKTKSSVKMRRGYSLHCWLPGDTPPPITTNNGLSVLGCAIIPELKPRVPTMSEKDLTRIYTPRHYLRS